MLKDIKQNECAIELIHIFSKIWQRQLFIEWKYRTKNVSNAFKGISAFGEIFASIYNEDYIGTGSGGLGYDLINQKENKTIEVKTSVTFQSNKCNNCNFKFSKIFNECSNCKSNDFKIINDSRFGINAKTLLEAYKSKQITNLTCFHMFDMYDENTKNNNDEIIFMINCYEIPFNYNNSSIEEKRIRYFENQLENSSKSNSCNLLPLSYDFFLLSPKLFDSWMLIIDYKNINKNPIIKNVWNEKLSNILVNMDICNNKNEKDKFMTLETYDVVCKNVELPDFVKHFEYRKKNFNKNRGEIKSLLRKNKNN